MDIRCSILGHTYQETEVEREREDRGEEEVITLREFRECRRCGNRDLVSENKHVRAVQRSTDDPPQPPEPEETPEDDTTTVGPPPRTDDAEVLTEEREPGAWPDRPERQEGESAGAAGNWPEHGDAVDEGYSAGPSDGGEPDVEFGDGLVPESAGEGDDGSEIIEAPSDGIDVDQYYGEPNRDDDDDSVELPKGERVADDVSPYIEVEYLCPNCGFTAPTGTSSLRTGDICPRCHKGYLGEREI